MFAVYKGVIRPAKDEEGGVEEILEMEEALRAEGGGDAGQYAGSIAKGWFMFGSEEEDTLWLIENPKAETSRAVWVEGISFA